MKALAYDLLLATLLVGIGVLGRSVPHAPNATPVAAAALFAAFAIRTRFVAFTVPLLTLALSDLFVHGFYDPRVIVVVYGSMAALVGLRRWLHGPHRATRVVVGSLGGSLLFFLTTNFAVWSAGWGYTPDLSGLLACYVNGLPFLKNAVVGDLCWCGLLFGGAAALETAGLRTFARPSTTAPATTG